VERLERRFVAIDKNVRQAVAGQLLVQPRLVDLVDVDVIVQAGKKSVAVSLGGRIRQIHFTGGAVVGHGERAAEKVGKGEESIGGDVIFHGCRESHKRECRRRPMVPSRCARW